MTANIVKGVKGFQSRPVAERFWEKVERRGADECWPWLGASGYSGRGQFFLHGRNVSAPRIAWELANNVELSPALQACHSCDNPNCVNPGHIWPGTMSDNILDAVNKGRVVCNTSANQRRHVCKRGHLFTPENTYIDARGDRLCRACQRMHAARCAKNRRAAKAAARAALAALEDQP